VSFRPYAPYLLACFAGCAAPGATLDLVQATPASIAIEYTHSYSTELGESLKRAEAHCNRYGRNAEMVSNTRLNLDRSLATFRCIRI
jgi:hypothetical protein